MHDLRYWPRSLSDADIVESVRRVASMSDSPRAKVFIAPDGGSGRPPISQIPHEMVWSPVHGRGHDASRSAVFIGALSGCEDSVAVVGAVACPDRRELRRTLATAMCRRCFDEPAAVREAERLLRAAADLPEGTLVRLTPDGAIVPVASAAAEALSR